MTGKITNTKQLHDPATCEHKRTAVVNSRDRNSVNSQGYPHFSETPYPCMRRRRRDCYDCGVRFTTVEVPINFIDHLLNERFPNVDRMRRKILHAIGEVVAEQLLYEHNQQQGGDNGQ